MLLSSHLMTEMAVTVDRVLIIGKGRVIEDTSVAEMRDRFERDVLVCTPRTAELTGILTRLGATVTRTGDGDGDLIAVGVDAPAIGDAAAAASIPIPALTPRSATLKDVYLE